MNGKRAKQIRKLATVIANKQRLTPITEYGSVNERVGAWGLGLTYTTHTRILRNCTRRVYKILKAKYKRQMATSLTLIKKHAKL